MNYRVHLKKEDGTEETRVIDAPSRFAVYGEAEKEGSIVLSISEGGGKGFSLGKLAQLNIGSGVKTEERITLTKNLSAMLSAGLTLSRALAVIERQTRNRTLKRIVSDLEEEVKKGTAFHEGLEKHANIFSKLFIAMTKAGEESGTLADALKVVARQMDRSFTLNKKIKGAMIYPSIILSAIVVIGVLMLIYVVPTLSNTFKELGVPLPTATRIIVGASDFMASHVIIVFLILGAIFAGIFMFTHSKIGQRIILAVSMRLPVIGDLVRETYAARAARALASLLSSGVEMLSAISIAEEVVGDNVFGKVVGEAAVRVRKGEALSAAFADHPKLYPFFIADMIAVGEETGKVADMLSQVAEYYETDVEEKTKDLSTIIEPVLMLVIGVSVGIFAIAMITPIYSLSSKI
ncbi:MAG: ral secretion pathway protein [Parcubacteria group bacterium]|nr:ral secretion pathway protein [Parcubacteria group bacterium]